MVEILVVEILVVEILGPILEVEMVGPDLPTLVAAARPTAVGLTRAPIFGLIREIRGPMFKFGERMMLCA
jgi:hypothetical protein